MVEAANLLKGEHDFKSFCGNQNEKSTVVLWMRLISDVARVMYILHFMERVSSRYGAHTGGYVDDWLSG